MFGKAFKFTLKTGAYSGLLLGSGYAALEYRCKKLRDENMDWDLT